MAIGQCTLTGKMTRHAAALIVALSIAFPTAQVSVDSLIAAIEGPQTGRDGPLVALSLQDAMKSVGVPGLSVAVIQDFEIHWTLGYGVADVVSGAKVTPETLFQAASISKPVAAMAILKAVQDKRFGLDEDVNKILTSWKVPASEHTVHQPITLRGLLSHTSGTDDG
jgi:CubicO group peptidase (beta-lactamase class C family)